MHAPVAHLATVELPHSSPSGLNPSFGQFLSPRQNSGTSHSPTDGRHERFSAAGITEQLRQHVLLKSSQMAPAFSVQLAKQHGLFAQATNIIVN